MATTDIRLKRIEKEYQSVRDGQDDILDRIDTYEAALLGLTEMVTENREMILENSRKLDALIEHLEVPYKPQAGFVKE
jgi:uncharacterized coiled-coil protein SlyX